MFRCRAYLLEPLTVGSNPAVKVAMTCGPGSPAIAYQGSASDVSGN